jgi:hypothetical protein
MLTVHVTDGDDFDAAHFQCRFRIDHPVPTDADDTHTQFALIFSV